jgi:uncharacterized protein YijF (DUF1287 family)
VCTDEVIRSYRALGIDLQKEVHEDMVLDFDAYPHRWQRQPDSNIDHRRVPNLMVFFGGKECGLRSASEAGTTSQEISWPGIWAGESPT